MPSDAEPKTNAQPEVTEAARGSEELSTEQLSSVVGGTGNNNNDPNPNNVDLPCGGVGCGITHGHE